MTIEIYSFDADSVLNVNQQKCKVYADYSTVINVNPEIDYKLIINFKMYTNPNYDISNRYFKLNVNVQSKTCDGVQTIICYDNFCGFNYFIVIDHMNELKKTMNLSKSDDPIGLIALKIYQLYFPDKKISELPSKNIHKLDLIKKSYDDYKRKCQTNSINQTNQINSTKLLEKTSEDPQIQTVLVPEKAFKDMQNKIQEHEFEIAKLKNASSKSNKTNESEIVKLTRDLEFANNQIINFIDDFKNMDLQINKQKETIKMLKNKIIENKIEKQQFIELMHQLNNDIENFKTEKNNEIKKLNQQITNQQNN